MCLISMVLRLFLDHSDARSPTSKEETGRQNDPEIDEEPMSFRAEL